MTRPGGHPQSCPSPPGILVVDDEPLILSLLALILQPRGFQVWQAGSGPAAVDLYRQHQRNIHIVLLDVRMPGMDGPRTLAELRGINPAVVCCFMSGETGLYSADDLRAMGAMRLIPKPFQPLDLADDLWNLVQQGRRLPA